MARGRIRVDGTRWGVRSGGWALVCLGLLPGASGCDRAANEYAPPPPPTVTVSEARVEEVVETLEFPARAEARAVVQIRARVPGYLEEVAFEPGAVVEAGTLLYSIEEESYVARRDTAAADLARLQAQLELAETRLTRAQRAFEQGAVSDIEIIQTRAERDVAAAEVEAAEAQLADAELQLSYTTITAPLTGRLSESSVDVGNLVGAGESTLLTTLVDDRIVQAYFDVDERALLRLMEMRGGRRSAPGDRAEQATARLTLADGSAYPIEGVLDFGDNRINPETGTLRARAVFENPRGILVDGMFCRVRVPVQRREALTIPEIAVARDASGAFVLVVNEEDVAERRRVTLGQRFGDRIAALEGLEAGERIIVAGVQRARDGLPVDPREEEAGEGARPGATPPSAGTGEREADEVGAGAGGGL